MAKRKRRSTANKKERERGNKAERGLRLEKRP